MTNGEVSGPDIKYALLNLFGQPYIDWSNKLNALPASTLLKVPLNSKVVAIQLSPMSV